VKIVLVAEAIQPFRKAIVNALIRKGYKTLEATDGAEALRFFDGRCIDLLITERNIPAINAMDLIRNIREMPSYKSLPTLILSSEVTGEQEDQQVAQRTSWITKPIDLERFMRVVEQSVA